MNHDPYDERMQRYVDTFKVSSTGCAVDCACGRIHFATAEGCGNYERDYEDGKSELEYLLEQAEKDPEKYFPHPYSYVDIVQADGERVPGRPCGRVEKIIGYLESNADMLVEFLTKFYGQKSETLQTQLHRSLQCLARLNSLGRSEDVETSFLGD